MVSYIRLISDDFSQRAQILASAAVNSCSPWAFAETVTRRAEKGEAAPLETGRILDLTQFLHQKSWSDYLPLLPRAFRTVHVVNDIALIIKGLKGGGRSSNRYAIYPTIIDDRLDPHNMLLCPQEEHRRLKNPFVKTLSPSWLIKNILGSLVITNRIYVSLGKSPVVMHSSLEDQVRVDIEEALSKGEITQTEGESTLKALIEASHHTTMITTAFITKLLRTHPEWQRKVGQEWEERFGPFDDQEAIYNHEVYIKQVVLFISGGEWEDKEITPSPSLFALVKEALRLYPALPQIVRIAKENFMLGGTEIQAEDIVVFNIMGYQRDARQWKDPTLFCPERFLGETPHLNFTDGKDLLNFSYGPEHCIGKYLAKYNLLSYTLSLIWNMLKSENRTESTSDIPSYAIAPPFITPVD